MAEEGKLSIQDNITKYIENYPTHGHKITIEHLLPHTSGIRSYTSTEIFDKDFQKVDKTTDEMLEVFQNEPMDFAPGAKFSYNNSGYFLLGVIIEKTSGKTYAQYIEETFFKPLGMKNSFYDNPNRIIKNRVAGYQKHDGHYENADYLSMDLPFVIKRGLDNF